MTAETMQPPLGLPEATSPEVSRALIAKDAEALRKVFEGGGTSEFEAQLSEIVGYVPEAEREFFETQAKGRIGSFTSWLKRPEELSGTWGKIIEDLERIGQPELAESGATLQVVAPVPGGDHVDSITSPDQANGVFYLVSNRHGTVSKKGNGELYFDHRTGVTGLNKFEPEIEIPAPDFAIVRMTYANVHSASPATVDGQESKVLLRAIF